MRTTDEEVIYSRDVGGHNIMKILTERVYCQKNRKDVEETHEAQKISCLLLKAQKRAWNGSRHIIMVPHLWIIECHRNMLGIICRKPDGGNPKQSETIENGIDVW